jgi:cytochrome c-type biogenesis protein CcmH
MATPETPLVPPVFDLSQLKRQLQQLIELHAAGALSQESFDEGRARMERRILDEVLRDGSLTDKPVRPVAVSAVSAGTPEHLPRAKTPLKLMAILTAAIVVIAAAGYGWMRSVALNSADGNGGEASTSSPDGTGPGKPHATNFDQIAAMTEKLAARLKDNPQDTEGWAMLARSYTVLGRHPEALGAYEKAVALRTDDAVLLADYADALALKNNRSLAGEPMKVVERALKIDPRNIKALSLAGTHAFGKKDYAAAVKYWEQVVEIGPASNSLVDQVLAGLADARELAGLPPVVRLSAPKVAPTSSDRKSLSGTVRLVPSLSGDAKPEDAVYIFVRSVEGSRMPLALLQKQVKDLPVQFTLDDSMAMSPESTLSKAGNVIVSARISKSGNAMPQKGDLIGQSTAVAVGAKDVMIEIKDIVKQ